VERGMSDEEHEKIVASLYRRTPLAVRVYHDLRAAADVGAACPVNRWLCENLGYGGHHGNMSAVLVTLVRNGLITLKRGRYYRQVTILHTGRSTKPIPDGGERKPRKSHTRTEGWSSPHDPELVGDERPSVWIMRVQGLILQRRAEGLPVW
jgi:hypothetical protein